MKKSLSLILLVVSAGLLAACDSASSQLSYCYQVEDALVIIAPDALNSYDTVTIVDDLGEQETIGEIRGENFYYGDGSYLAFSNEEVLGFGGLIEGLSGPAVSCP